MRVSKRGAGLLAIAALLLPAGARADELLVMPYACTMSGGQPVLTPGPEQSHRIVGPRDQRRFSACSPVNPDMCREWTVHRFDIDCDGARVPWVSVVAATSEGSHRAWLLGGRLVLRMGPRWSLAPDDPCALEAEGHDRLSYRRMRRYCADRLAMAPPVVEMPFGYAPMLGIDGIFVKAAPGVSGAPSSLPRISAAPRPAKSAAAEPPPELFRTEPLPQPAPREWPRREPAGNSAIPPAPPRAAVQRPQPPPKAIVPPGTPAVTFPTAEVSKAVPRETKPTAPTPNLGPRVVALSPPAPKPAAPATPAAAPPASTSAAAEAKAAVSGAAPTPKVAAPAPSSRNNGEQPDRGPSSPTGSGDGTTAVSVLSVFRATTTGAIVAFAGLALGLLTAFALARRREHMNDARRRPRDPAAVSLDGKRARSAVRVGKAHLPPHAPASAMGRAAAASATPEEWGDRMPQTRAEALRVLGIGIAPTASDAAIKKIVDGLRQSWHPDLAGDEADRALRELRSKQINAAWDLLRGQRAEV